VSLMPEPGKTIPVRRLLYENRWPLIAETMSSIQFYYTIHIIIDNTVLFGSVVPIAI